MIDGAPFLNTSVCSKPCRMHSSQFSPMQDTWHLSKHRILSTTFCLNGWSRKLKLHKTESTSYDTPDNPQLHYSSTTSCFRCTIRISRLFYCLQYYKPPTNFHNNNACLKNSLRSFFRQAFLQVTIKQVGNQPQRTDADLCCFKSQKPV